MISKWVSINLRAARIDIGVLASHLGQRRAVIPVGVAHGVQEHLARVTCALPVLVVADFINYEEQIDKVATGPKLIVSSVGIGVGNKELVAPLKEEREFASFEHVVAVDPCARFSTGLGIVGTGRSLERAGCKEIGKRELGCRHRWGEARVVNEEVRTRVGFIFQSTRVDCAPGQ